MSGNIVPAEQYDELGLPDPMSLEFRSLEIEAEFPLLFRRPEEQGGDVFVRVQIDGTWVWRAHSHGGDWGPSPLRSSFPLWSFIQEEHQRILRQL